ncbi:guanylate kinase [Allomyces macrogynus ATCC 38327]|uniref:Guanylate kinase n=1 Tax=Allomyces macrogynus (strain ATCC 38327) TaxID=578462 RepID=A0A0L0SZA5_ALLM3|nr:guanylate kinase [Allomyces macrogynus ATCC 38327]|eukprot:KNE67831.1 guanylate kinase [Allomyces macrogynus ATCC 38327]
MSDAAPATTPASAPPAADPASAPANDAKDNTRPLVVSGPSGSGKSTLLNRLFKEFPDQFGFSVSHTTRLPRPGETDGVSYHFVTREAFDTVVASHGFIEHAEFSGNCYGTSIAAVQAVTATPAPSGRPRVCVLDIEQAGVRNVKKSDLRARFVFIKPPSVEEIEKRLRGRGTETEESLKARVATAVKELEEALVPGTHDVIIVNDDADRAYEELKAWVIAHYELDVPCKPVEKKVDAPPATEGKKKSKFCVIQ